MSILSVIVSQLITTHHSLLPLYTTTSTGEEAIHIGADSSRFLIEGNTISNTGRVEAGLGRGIYIGSDKGTTDDNYVPTVSSITVRNNVIGPDVRAEGIDVRADSHDVSSIPLTK